MTQKEGVWLRGNLHMHTARSDGKLDYEEAVALYERAGYDFIAVTDHWVRSETGTTAGGMLLLSGCEYNIGETVQSGVYHIVGVGMERAPVLEHTEKSPQRIIDEIRAAGGVAILAHPAWSLNSAEAVAKLTGLCGTEIYNTTSAVPPNMRPYSGLFVDQLASLGVLLPCMAADDAHRYERDATVSSIMVHAREKSHDAVMEALRAGDFYATQGPSVTLTVEKGEAVVTCSPAVQVEFHSDAVWNESRVAQGEGITKARFRLLPFETFVRAEVVDSEGRRAFSSPVHVK